MNVVALISSFNEEDVIYHVIGDLISNNINVYLIDNQSTDNTVAEAGKWLGKGLIRIEQFPSSAGSGSDDKVYNWLGILKRKEELAIELNADWYIHADADEFRESPFPRTTLFEGIKIVDECGFNAINFEVLNFRPTDNDFDPGSDVREHLQFYEPGEWFDSFQIKAWKNTVQPINLTDNAGHQVIFQNRKVCPVNFILRHYPIRSQQHGEIKLFRDRFPRFSEKERKMGWHIQYDEFRASKKSFLCSPEGLTEYNRDKQCRKLMNYAINIFSASSEINKLKDFIKSEYSEIISNAPIEFCDDNKTSSKPEISIIIPSFNTLNYTGQMIESLFKTTKSSNYEVIIVDNNSTDGTKKLLYELTKQNKNISPFRVILNNQNFNFAGACNQGAAAAKGKYLLFLNTDVILTPGWLEPLIQTIESDEKIAIVGNKHLFPGTDEIHHAGICIHNDLSNSHYLVRTKQNNPRVNFHRDFTAINAACILVRKNVFDLVGGFDVTFINSSEDIDFCFKVIQNGYRIVYTPDSLIYHYGQKSPGRSENEINNNKILIERWKNIVRPDEKRLALDDLKRIASLRKNSNSQKIVFLTTYNQQCGIATHAEYLTNSMKEQFGASGEKYDIYYFAEDTRNIFGADDEFVYRLWNREYDDFSACREALEILLPEILHIEFQNGLWHNTKIVDFVDFAKSMNIKVFVTFHSSDGDTDICVDLINKADKSFVHIEQSKKLFISFGAIPDKIEVWPVGINTKIKKELTIAEARTKLNLPNDIVILTTFGFVDHHKGIKDIIEEFPLIKQYIPNCKFFIIGNVHEYSVHGHQYLEECKRKTQELNLNDSIIFITQYVPDDLLSEFLYASDAIILNYKIMRNEASGIAAIALAHRRPLITTLTPTFVPFIKCTYQLSAGHGIAESALLVLSNPTLRNYLVKEGDKAIAEGSFDRLAEMTLGQYRQYLANRLESVKSADKGNFIFDNASGLPPVINPALGNYIEKINDKYIIFKDYYREVYEYTISGNRANINTDKVNRFNNLFFNNTGPYYLLFGGIGDFLLGLSTFYDKYNGETVICIPNSIKPAIAFLDNFPKLKNVIIFPLPVDWIIHSAVRSVYAQVGLCKSRGITPFKNYDEEWVPGLDIFEKYGVIEHPKWIDSFKKEKSANPQVVLAPKGSAIGPQGKKKHIPPDKWLPLIEFLKKHGISPILLGTPDEIPEYPFVEGCIEKRSWPFDEQMELLASADLVIAADSWHKSCSALAGVRTIVFRSVLEAVAKDHIDVSENVFLHPWKDITVVNNFEEFLAVFDSLKGTLTSTSKQTLSANADVQRPLTTFSPYFWQTDYNSINSVLIVPTTAIGDNLMLTALVQDMKNQFPHLDIYIYSNPTSNDIFKNHPAVKEFVSSPAGKKFDKVIDYNNIIAKFPEYYNGIKFMDILGNMAGIKFNERNLVYQPEFEEIKWAKKELTRFVLHETVGLQFSTSKDVKRSYPHGAELIKILSRQIPDLRFVLFGGELTEKIDRAFLYDASGCSLRENIALASQCKKFITIDSAFFHVGHNLFNKPTMLIAGLTNPQLIGNHEQGFAFVRNEKLDCLKCYWGRQCNIECMKDLAPAAVAEAFTNIADLTNYESGQTKRKIKIYDNTDVDKLIFDYFASKCDAQILELDDKARILPDYVYNWNGIEIAGEGDDTQNYSENDYYVESVLLGGASTVAEAADDRNDSYDFLISNDMNPDFFNIENEQPHQLGMDFFAGEGKSQQQSGEPSRKKLNIVWEGSQFVNHSLALINREQCSNLIDAGTTEVTIVPYEPDSIEWKGNPKYEKLASYDIRFKQKPYEDITKLPFVWIRHQWPPKGQEPLGAKWIINQPWEYSTLPKNFVEIFHKADEIWTPSTYSRQCFINSGIEFNKVQIVPNGIDPELFRPDGSKYDLRTTKIFKFLFVGGTIFRKGIDVLLEAYLKAFKRNDDVVLVIKDMGGDSFYRGQTFKSQIEKITSADEAPEVIYIDSYLTEAEIASLYRACDVFVSPYRGEGFSLPALEAMACGLPVVVTAGGATDDFVDEEVGWLIPAEKRSIGNVIDNQPLTGEAFVLEPDGEFLKDTLTILYDRPSDIFSKGLSAAKRARTEWTWKKSTIQVLSRLDVLYGTSLAYDSEASLAEDADETALLSEAESLFKSQAVEQSQILLSQLIKTTRLKEKHLLHAVNLLAYGFVLTGNTEMAFKTATTAFSLSHNNPDSRYINALIYIAEGNQSEALKMLTGLFDDWQTIKFDTTLGITLDDLLNETGFILLDMEDSDGALKLFTEALKYNSKNAVSCFGAAKCFLTVDAVGEAKNMLNWAIELEPGFNDAIELLNSLSEDNPT